MDNDFLFYSGGRHGKAALNELYGRMYCDTDGIIKLKEVNNMKDWLVVHADVDGSPLIIRKDSITCVHTDEDGGTVIQDNNFSYLISEKYADIVRRLVK